MQFALRYGKHLIRPPTAPMTFGSAWHDGAGVDYHHKSETGEHLPVEDTVEHAVESLRARKDETLWGDEKFGDCVDQLSELQREYARGLARETNPIKGGVERQLKITLGKDVEVTGYIDVVDEIGSIDLKSTAKKWSARQAQTMLDPLIYTMDEPGVSTFRFHIGVRKTFPEVHLVTLEVDESAKAGARSYTHFAAHEMQKVINDPEDPGLSLPTGFGGFMCSQRQCGYWRECQARWGLPIPQ
jgi:hypothetical protein